MGKIIFILGGVRSGKSSYAINLAKRSNKKVAFIATCSHPDREMKKRIEIHKKSRPPHWQTFENPIDLVPMLKKIGSKSDIIVIDCLTLFVSDLLIKGLGNNAIEKKIEEMLKIIKLARYKSIIVSNEVGLGIVPVNPLGRRFRDLAGRINQMIALRADEVIFMVSGLPLKIKDMLKKKRDYSDFLLLKDAT